MRGQFARYLAQEIHSTDELGGGSSSESDADEDEEDGGWLARSHFEIDHPPPIVPRPRTEERRPLSANGFDVSHRMPLQLLRSDEEKHNSGRLLPCIIINSESLQRSILY